LEKLIDAINAGRPQCPVGLNTLVIPRKVNIGDQVNQPYVYLNCGHVQGMLQWFKILQQNYLILPTLAGHHDWGQDENTGARRCPMCLELGPVVTLCMGLEPAFYVDVGAPTYAFNPCGHMATEKTVKWAIAASCGYEMTLLIVGLSLNLVDTGPMWRYLTVPTDFRPSVPSVRRPWMERLAT